MKDEVCGFKCTGYDGKKVWEKLHKLPKEIDCETCSEHASVLFSGVHDTVSAGLGKPAHDPKNFKKFAKEVQCAYDSCVKSGNCKEHELE